MRIAAVLAVVAAVSPGPGVLRAARPADAIPATGRTATTQTYWFAAVDARTRSSLQLLLGQTGSTTGLELTYWPAAAHSGYSDTYHDLGLPGAKPGYTVRGASVRRTARGWSVRLDQGTVHVSLTLSAVRGGPTASSWPIGRTAGPPPLDYSFHWSVPIAASAVDGSLQFDGKTVAIHGWRGFLDHTWGLFDMGAGLMQHWDEAVVQAGAGAWIVDGFETGPGISQGRGKDSQWRGVLVRVGSGATSFCRARARRTGWADYYQGLESFDYPHTLTATCGGRSITFRRLPNTNAYAYSTGYVITAASTSAGGYGLWTELNQVS